MRSSIISVVPTETPVSLDDLKLRVRYGANDYDSQFRMHLLAAIEYCQEYQWAQYCTATYVDKFDTFQQILELLRSPVQSVTSVQYLDTGGVLQTLAAGTDYIVDTNAKPCRITPAYAKYWPAIRAIMGSVTVTYVAGYGSPSDVPDEIKMAILLKAAQMYESCESEASEASLRMMLDKKSFRVFY